MRGREDAGLKDGTAVSCGAWRRKVRFYASWRPQLDCVASGKSCRGRRGIVIPGLRNRPANFQIRRGVGETIQVNTERRRKIKSRGETGYPEKTRRQAASSGTTPQRAAPVGIEPGSPRKEGCNSAVDICSVCSRIKSNRPPCKCESEHVMVFQEEHCNLGLIRVGSHLAGTTWRGPAGLPRSSDREAGQDRDSSPCLLECESIGLPLCHLASQRHGRSTRHAANPKWALLLIALVRQTPSSEVDCLAFCRIARLPPKSRVSANRYKIVVRTATPDAADSLMQMHPSQLAPYVFYRPGGCRQHETVLGNPHCMWTVFLWPLTGIRDCYPNDDATISGGVYLTYGLCPVALCIPVHLSSVSRQNIDSSLMAMAFFSRPRNSILIKLQNKSPLPGCRWKTVLDDATGRRVFSEISYFPPAPSIRRCSILTSITFVGSQDLVKSHPNLFTLHSSSASHLAAVCVETRVTSEADACLNCRKKFTSRARHGPLGTWAPDHCASLPLHPATLLVGLKCRQMCGGNPYVRQKLAFTKHMTDGRIEKIAALRLAGDHVTTGRTEDWRVRRTIHRNERAGKREFPEKTLRPAASSSTSPTCENPGTTPSRIEPGSHRREASSLTTPPTAAP
ncbi:hypothetical protein PR048_027983 [Dryococelus australis]|uniref:Uncharacterized protein n=1 Tax=Dryococelus australis TaxID=614101 RepID=A0ABQ9GHY8_9NEOP|nr:hypothetical protein PR048_027983 [Dryococelus australis]